VQQAVKHGPTPRELHTPLSLAWPMPSDPIQHFDTMQSLEVREEDGSNQAIHPVVNMPSNISNMSALIIGIISDPEEDFQFRTAARTTWVRSAKDSGLDMQPVFFFPQRHSSDRALQEEAKTHGDVVFGIGDSNMPVAYQMLEHLSQKFNALHILRVNVRSYVVVDRLLARLETLCERPACAGEDIWAGRMVTSRSIRLQDAHYSEDTRLAEYLPYMSADAYILSTTLAQSLSLMHTDIGLKMYSAEDISMGVWLIPMASRRIDLGSAVHIENSCCFDDAGTMTVDICDRMAEQYPVILSLLDKPEYLQQYHNALASCPDQTAFL
jgi:Galactosyltransferase